MLKKFACSVFTASALFCTSALAMNYSLSPNATVDYDLPANSPTVFSNYFFWTITATCTVHSKDDSNTIIIKGLNKKGKINDTPISAGETLVITVRDNEKILISADSGAKVELTNQGPNTVSATCTTS